MTIPTHSLTLKVSLPDDATPIEGTWRIWLATQVGVAIDDAGNGIAGAELVPTASGIATINLPDTTSAGFDPQGALYRASFMSTDRRVRLKSEPFLMDADKTFDDIIVATAAPVTPSIGAQADAARDAAAASAAAASTSAATAASWATAAATSAASAVGAATAAIAGEVTRATTAEAALQNLTNSTFTTALSNAYAQAIHIRPGKDGVKGDAKVATAAMTAGSATLTATTGVFTSADIGKSIWVPQAVSAILAGTSNAVNIVTGGDLVLQFTDASTATVTLVAGDTPATVVTKINAQITTRGTASLVSSRLQIVASVDGLSVVSGAGTTLANLGLAVNRASVPRLLSSTISGYTSATQVTLAVPATATVATTTVTYGTDDTAAINAVLNTVNVATGLTTVYMHSGTYLIDSVNEAGGTSFGRGYDIGVQPLSGTTLILDSAATLKVIPNDSPFYSCIYIGSGKTGITVKGGSIECDRLVHTFLPDPIYPTHEFGYGIQIRAADKVTVEGMHIYGATGDNVFYGYTGRISTSDYVPSTNQVLKNCVIDNARRNNISATGNDVLLIENNTVTNAGQADANHDGTAPRAGIDLEPDSGNQMADNIIIRGNRFTGNKSMSINGFKSDRTIIESNFSDNTISYGWGTLNQIRGNVFYAPTNTTNEAITSLADIAGRPSYAVISNNIIVGFNIGITADRNCLVTGNYIAGFSGYGIQTYSTLEPSSIVGNIIRDGSVSSIAVGSFGPKVLIGSNYIFNVNQVGYFPAGVAGTQVIFENNLVKQCNIGIVGSSGTDLAVKGNIFNLAGHANGEGIPVEIQSGGLARIEGNTFRNCATYGVKVKDNGTHKISVLRNTFRDVKTTAIYVDGGKVDVVGNTIIGTLATGTLGPAIVQNFNVTAGGSVVDNFVTHGDVVLFTSAVDTFDSVGVFVSRNQITDGVRVRRGSSTNADLYPAPDPLRVLSVTSTTSLAINSDLYEMVTVTALAQTMAVANPTGTPTAGQRLLVRIKDNGTSQTITWGTQFRGIGVTLPAATVAGVNNYVSFLRNNVDSKWDAIAVVDEGIPNYVTDFTTGLTA